MSLREVVGLGPDSIINKPLNLNRYQVSDNGMCEKLCVQLNYFIYQECAVDSPDNKPNSRRERGPTRVGASVDIHRALCSE